MEWGEKKKFPSEGNWGDKVMNKAKLLRKISGGRTPGEGRGREESGTVFSWIPEAWQRTIAGPLTLGLKGTCWSAGEEDSFSSLSGALIRGRPRSVVCDWGINNGEDPLSSVYRPLLYGRTARYSFAVSIRFDILCESEKYLLISEDP